MKQQLSTLTLAALATAASSTLLTGAASAEGARGELYGFAMVDMGYNDGSIQEDWFDVVRPTQLPNRDIQNGDFNSNKYTTPGSTYASVRQSRLGVKGWFPTPSGHEVHTIFEFEMFGTGSDAGQTTIRLRHAYGEMGAFGGGQYWSPFMDINVFPNSVEYWGPTGMAFFRNVQFRWMPVRSYGEGGSDLTFALERPGFGRDGAIDEIEDSINNEQSGIDVRYPVPDLSAAYSYGGDWGYARIAGILRYVSWEGDLVDGNVTSRVDDKAVGFGLNFSTNLYFGPGDSVLKFAVVGGQGIQNYMNDATGDLGIDSCGNDCIEAVTIPMLGTTLFYDLWWSEKFSSTIGFSTLDIDNQKLDNPYNLREGRYALVNLLYYPASNVMFGAELQYGKRKNFGDDSDEYNSDDYDKFNDPDFDYDLWRIQLSARYNFSFGLGG